MAQPEGPQSEPQPTTGDQQPRQLLDTSQQNGIPSLTVSEAPAADQLESRSGHDVDDAQHHGNVDAGKPSHARTSRSVVPGLPRAQTLKRQLSESRAHLIPVSPCSDEKRAASMDRRSNAFSKSESHIDLAPRPTSSCFLGLPPKALYPPASEQLRSKDFSRTRRESAATADQQQAWQENLADPHPAISTREDMIQHELETTWILNLSMHFKDESRREKFFVTYRQTDHLWRRVTVSLDYTNAPHGSLELDLKNEKFQKVKSAKIYEAIRDSLSDIQFYDTVTNLKLETEDERLHIHVVEDGNEIIEYPSVAQVDHLDCPHIPESSINFESHMSGFVYKVHVGKATLIKKEIPGPDTIQEFLYEVNALANLGYSDHVIEFCGLVVDERNEFVKGLLIGYADNGALADIIYDHCIANKQRLSWPLRERWAQQIIQGLADVHESGFVQGDFTLSNIVIDHKHNAKLIDINRRGCPVGWEPPEAGPLLRSNNRIAMYIGNKSDLYQLGIVLWALAMEVDEPEKEREKQPYLSLDSNLDIPAWYRQVTEICLSPDPKNRLQASILVRLCPEDSQITVEEDVELHKYDYNTYHPPTVFMGRNPSVFSRSSYAYNSDVYNRPPSYGYWSEYDPRPRGRSPGDFADSYAHWGEKRHIRPCYTDVDIDEERLDDVVQQIPSPIPEAFELDKPDQSNDQTPEAEYGHEGGNSEPITEKQHESSSLGNAHGPDLLPQEATVGETHSFRDNIDHSSAVVDSTDQDVSPMLKSFAQLSAEERPNVFSFLQQPTDSAQSIATNEKPNGTLTPDLPQSVEERETQQDSLSQNAGFPVAPNAPPMDGRPASHHPSEPVGQMTDMNSRQQGYNATIKDATPRSAAAVADLVGIGTFYSSSLENSNYSSPELEI